MSNILIVGGGFAGVWSAAAAARLRRRHGSDFSITLVAPGDDLVIRPRLYEYTAVVVGAGFTGIEVATELVSRLHAVADAHGAAGEVRVVLVERAGVVGPDLGPGPRPVIVRALDDLGVERRLGVTPQAVDPAEVVLSDGSTVAAATVVWTAGMRAGPLTTAIPGHHDRLGRLEVDSYLEVAGAPGVYAAGDTAAARTGPGGEHGVVQSCQHASPLGKHAGHNVAADLMGLRRVAFEAPPYVTCLDLGLAGAVFTTGFERTVRLTGDEGKRRKRAINQSWIYPPTDDAAELLRRADHRFVNRDLGAEPARGTAGTAGSVA